MLNLTIKGFLENSFLDWPGRIASVIFLPGCNFRCYYCHNWPLVAYPASVPTIPLEQIFKRLDKFRYKRSGVAVGGVVVSGGEPTLHPQLPELLGELKMRGLATKLDTNGSKPDVLCRLVHQGLLDFVALDIKAPLEPEAYADVAGCPVDVRSIRKSLDLLLSDGIDYELRTTLTPAILGQDRLQRLLEQIRGAKRWTLQNYRIPPGIGKSGNQRSTLDRRRSTNRCAPAVPIGKLIPLELKRSFLSPYPASTLERIKRLAANYVKECRIAA